MHFINFGECYIYLSGRSEQFRGDTGLLAYIFIDTGRSEGGAKIHKNGRSKPPFSSLLYQQNIRGRQKKYVFDKIAVDKIPRCVNFRST